MMIMRKDKESFETDRFNFLFCFWLANNTKRDYYITVNKHNTNRCAFRQKGTEIFYDCVVIFSVVDFSIGMLQKASEKLVCIFIDIVCCRFSFLFFFFGYFLSQVTTQREVRSKKNSRNCVNGCCEFFFLSDGSYVRERREPERKKRDTIVIL